MGNDISTDIYMTTVHKRRVKKGKVSFSMVMNKVLIGAVVITSLMGSVGGAYADTSNTQPIRNNTQTNVEMQYSQSVENAKYTLENTIKELEVLRKEEGRVTKTLLKELAENLYELESSLKGVTATAEIFTLIDRAEATLESVPTSISEVQQAKRAISSIRNSLVIEQTITEENKKAAKVELSDIGDHWGKGYITKLVNLKGINGYPDGSFKPNQTITKAEFITVAVRSALDGKVDPQVGDHWASGVFSSARNAGVLLRNDFPVSEWNEPITRYEMAYVMVRITEQINSENKVSTSGVENIMEDYAKVSQETNYKYYVEQAFMKGLVTGMNANGLYNGEANGTRAEAATMVVRMLDKSERKAVDTGKVIVSDRVIDMEDPARPLMVREGDTVVNSSGEKVVLQKGPAGILGEGQGVDYYTGIVFEQTGYVFGHGSLGTKTMGYDGQTYMVDPKTGEGHFATEWNTIGEVYIQKARETHGNFPPAGTRYGAWYEFDGKYWVWQGPTNSGNIN